MHLGVDFDGVIADATREYQRFFLNYLGISLKPEELTKENQIAILGDLESYKTLHRFFCIGPSTARNDVVLNCREVLGKLIEEGHKITILTGREELAWNRAKEFLKNNKIPFHHILYNDLDRKVTKKNEKMTKALIAGRLKMDIFIDDSLKHLEIMSGSGIKLFFFTTLQNQSKRIIKQDIQRVAGWQDIYNRIFEMTNEAL